MLKLLVIDDLHCKKDLALFIKKHQGSVVQATTAKTLVQGIGTLLGAINKQAAVKRLAVSTTESLVLLNVHEIVRCESRRNYTIIYLTGDRRLMASKTLMDYETILGNSGFVRIHKSHLINMDYMDRYVKSEGGYMVLNDGTRLPVSVRKKEYLFKELDKLLASN